MQMHYRKNEDAVICLRVKDAVREPPHQRAPDFPVKFRPGFRIRNGALNRRMYFNGKIQLKTGLYVFVVLDGVQELCFRIRMKAETHPSNLLEIFSKTWSPGTVLTLPEWISSKRLRAIAAHFLSISGSGGFRERSRESATIARFSTGRDPASSIRSLSLIALPRFPARVCTRAACTNVCVCGGQDSTECRGRQTPS